MSYDICGKVYVGFLGPVSCALEKGHSGHCDNGRSWIDGTAYVRDEPLKKWVPKPFYKQQKERG